MANTEVYLPKDILVRICNFCGDTMEQRRDKNYNMVINQFKEEYVCYMNFNVPMFISLSYIGIRPAVLNTIDEDFTQYWEKWLGYWASDH
jgi:hypothetical protein